MSEPVVAQAEPYETELVAGEKYFWCACGLSATQPFCDGSHKVTDIRPIVFTAEESETAGSGCKKPGAAALDRTTHAAERQPRRPGRPGERSSDH